LRKVALEQKGVEEERLRAVVDFNARALFKANDVLTTVARMRKKSFTSFASEETDDVFRDVAGLLDWVKELGWRTSELTS
jgi:hypothetical protein